MLGREAAERATKSREVDLSRLKGFHLRFAPKNEKWRDLQLVSKSLNWMAEGIGSTPIDQNNRMCVRSSCVDRTSVGGGGGGGRWVVTLLPEQIT